MKSAVITGAYGAIGKAIARGVASKGYRVTLVGRDADRLEKVRQELEGELTNMGLRDYGIEGLRAEVVDLSLKREILAFAGRWSGPLDLLINNAATGPRKRTETAEGIEVQWATNVLAYFWMTDAMIPFMEGQPDARIVNVASYWAGGMNPDDPEFRNRRYDNDAAYRQAKQANRMLTVAFAERLKSKGITVNSCHPGDVNSKLSNSFGFGGSETPEEGAATPLYLALSEEVKGVTGTYYEHLRPAHCSFSRDRAGVERLYELCQGY